MPISVFDKLKEGQMIPINLPIFLTDRPIQYTRGVVEDILVQTDSIAVQPNFVVLNGSPLILGHPFIATVRVMLRRKNMKLPPSMRTEESAVKSRVSMQHSEHHDNMLQKQSLTFLHEIVEENKESPIKEVTGVEYLSSEGFEVINRDEELTSWSVSMGRAQL
ncbi:hypothetical protein L1987_32463 [Smallanthus sonchifolius]|uniref:Uncharacterized protein n=1 Tax=Smallanthus sonchifolius TaxID=185202 RepID=A0ACB9HPG7_9ASTR|nr:hypothetical protein L1987_32463 [Smallanthus sonchifolius]